MPLSERLQQPLHTLRPSCIPTGYAPPCAPMKACGRRYRTLSSLPSIAPPLGPFPLLHAFLVRRSSLLFTHQKSPLIQQYQPDRSTRTSPSPLPLWQPLWVTAGASSASSHPSLQHPSSSCAFIHTPAPSPCTLSLSHSASGSSSSCTFTRKPTPSHCSPTPPCVPCSSTPLSPAPDPISITKVFSHLPLHSHRSNKHTRSVHTQTLSKSKVTPLQVPSQDGHKRT